MSEEIVDSGSEEAGSPGARGSLEAEKERSEVGQKEPGEDGGRGTRGQDRERRIAIF